MAGTVMHLVIADRLLEKLGIRQPALFYCGNLAPDAIMARENYVREMKNHTHFKDGLRPFEFRIKENQDKYMPRLMAFYEEFFSGAERPDRELYVGYLTHILVDELYLLNHYEKHLIALEKQGIRPPNMEFSAKFVADVDLVDWELVRTYPFRYPMPETLLKEMDYEIPGWITNAELISSKRFIIDKNFVTPHEPEPLHVMSFQDNWDFIELCVKRVPEMLKERFGIGCES